MPPSLTTHDLVRKNGVGAPDTNWMTKVKTNWMTKVKTKTTAKSTLGAVVEVCD
jgi:hypothetical protein